MVNRKKKNTTTTRTGISAEERIDQLRGVAEEFNDFLKKSRGVVLSGRLRIAVAHCAREALLLVGGGDNSPPPPCRHFRSHKTDGADAFRDETKIQSVLTKLIHEVVCPNGLDQKWYQRTIRDLNDTTLVPRRFRKKDRQALVWSLYCEVVLLATVSHGLGVTFLALGDDDDDDKSAAAVGLPPVPDVDDKDYTGPTYLHWRSMIHTDRTIRQDEKVAFTPFLKLSDLNLSAPEIERRMAESTVSTLLGAMDTTSVWCGMVFSPEDLEFARYFVSVYYVDETIQSTPSASLSRETRCAGSFQRADVEYLAWKISEAYSPSCRHSTSAHSLLLGGTVDRMDRDQRKQANAVLDGLAQAVTARPLDRAKLVELRTQLFKTTSKEHGKAFWVEACGVAGGMETVTKVDAATGKTPVPKTVQRLGKAFLTVRKLLP